MDFPAQSVPDASVISILIAAVESGRAKAVGVRNCNAPQLQQAHDLLARAGVALASNEVEYSLLKRDIEEDGTLEACLQLGVSVIARSPLHNGLLTAAALERTDEEAAQVRPLLLLLKFIGALSGGKDVQQIALNYLLCKGAIALTSARSPEDVRSHAGAMGWLLEASEREVIDEKLGFMGF